MMKNFKNKQVVITGASGFIGMNLTERLFQLGAHVVCLTRNKQELERKISKFISNKYYPNTHLISVREVNVEYSGFPEGLRLYSDGGVESAGASLIVKFLIVEFPQYPFKVELQKVR